MKPRWILFRKILLIFVAIAIVAGGIYYLRVRNALRAKEETASA
jgi:hypothetical protein